MFTKILEQQSQARIFCIVLQNRKLEKPNHAFEFNKLCFICGLDASDEKEARQGSSSKAKNKIMHVTITSFTENVLQKIKGKVDDTSKNILRRISLTDLVAEQARYHKNCYQKHIAHADRLSINPVGAPLDHNITNQMQKSFHYIDKSNECQFTLQEFVELLGNWNKI